MKQTLNQKTNPELFKQAATKGHELAIDKAERDFIRALRMYRHMEATTMKQRKPKYQLLEGGKWVAVKKATTSRMQPGWLHWKDADGCTRLSRPGTWREKPAIDKAERDFIRAFTENKHGELA